MSPEPPTSRPPTPDTAAVPADTPDVSAAKAALRARIRADRRALSPEERRRQSTAAAAHLWEWLGPRLAAPRPDGAERRPTVATVVPMAAEPDTTPVRDRALDAGARVLVPVIEPGRRMSWTTWEPGVATARAATAPIDEPVGPREPSSVLDDAALVLLPALAVDRSGLRLGQGGGYYDRFLAELPETVPTVAYVFAHELLPAGEVPVEPTDRPVDGVLTAEGLLWCAGEPVRVP